jgi:hypothetical protein
MIAVEVFQVFMVMHMCNHGESAAAEKIRGGLAEE